MSSKTLVICNPNVCDPDGDIKDIMKKLDISPKRKLHILIDPNFT